MRARHAPALFRVEHLADRTATVEFPWLRVPPIEPEGHSVETLTLK